MAVDVTGKPTVCVDEWVAPNRRTYFKLTCSVAALGTLRWRSIQPMQPFTHEGRTWVVCAVNGDGRVEAEPLHQAIDRLYIGGVTAYRRDHPHLERL